MSSKTLRVFHKASKKTQGREGNTAEDQADEQ